EPNVKVGVNNAMAGVMDNTGEDLAGMVSAGPSAHAPAGTGPATAFADDMRDRSDTSATPPAPPETTSTGASLAPTTARTAESAQLHLKGGWRDHSDGNRITTTRGDKVEVIRGNYKLLVLGRQDDPGNAAGWDVSGGLVDGADLSKRTDVAH